MSIFWPGPDAVYGLYGGGFGGQALLEPVWSRFQRTGLHRTQRRFVRCEARAASGQPAWGARGRPAAHALDEVLDGAGCRPSGTSPAPPGGVVAPLATTRRTLGVHRQVLRSTRIVPCCRGTAHPRRPPCSAWWLVKATVSSGTRGRWSTCRAPRTSSRAWPRGRDRARRRRAGEPVDHVDPVREQLAHRPAAVVQNQRQRKYAPASPGALRRPGEALPVELVRLPIGVLPGATFWYQYASTKLDLPQLALAESDRHPGRSGPAALLGAVLDPPAWWRPRRLHHRHSLLDGGETHFSRKTSLPPPARHTDAACAILVNPPLPRRCPWWPAPPGVHVLLRPVRRWRRLQHARLYTSQMATCSFPGTSFNRFIIDCASAPCR